MTNQTKAQLFAVASGTSDSSLHQLSAEDWRAQLISVISITAELSEVVVIAKEISLTAANATAIAFRAGDKAKGFKPITDSITELAKETISKTSSINELAMALFKMTVNEHRKTAACDQFEHVKNLSDAAVYAFSIQKALDNAKIRVQDSQLQFKRDVALLLAQLEEVMSHAQTASIIATYSRIEASQADEYLQSLQAVAESVDKAAQTIHDKVQRCIMILSLFRK